LDEEGKDIVALIKLLIFARVGRGALRDEM